MSSLKQAVGVHPVRCTGHQCDQRLPIDREQRLHLIRFDGQDLIYFIGILFPQHIEEKAVSGPHLVQVGQQLGGG